MKFTTTESEKSTKSKKMRKVSYYRKPEKMSVEQWQKELRKQFARTNPFRVKNVGNHFVFSDFKVYNIKTDSTYKVAIRNEERGGDFCSCLDFKTNHLGTCKHIEAVLYDFEKKGFELQLSEKYQVPYTSVNLKYSAERKVMLSIGTDQREAFSRLADNYFDENNFLRPSAFDHFEIFLKNANAIGEDFRCYSDALEFIINQRDRLKRARILDEISSGGDEDNYFRHCLKTQLFPYQKTGVKFAFRAGRSLIADDMGLGKTIQGIAAAEMMKKELGIGKALIICPTSLKYQWFSEIEKFTDSSVQIIEGLYTKRQKQYGFDHFYKIVSLHTARNDWKEINTNDFDLIILDEAQRIKNWDTKMARNIKKLQSNYAIVLTGTPLENRLQELYSIMQFVDTYKLGPLHRYLENHQVTDATGKVTGYRNLNKIGETLSDVMLRRRKKEVLTQLPERTDKVLYVPMTEPQMKIHTDCQFVVAMLIRKWKRFGFLSEQDRQRLIINLNMMRMACDSTFILDQETRHETKIEELMNLLEEIFEMEGEKVVIFSQWERMTRLVSWELEEKGLKFENLHGGVPSHKRQALFDNFKNDPDCRVFLSTDAGGVGLNLQSASNLINLDLPWNPAVLEQRIGRIHRLGQKSNVSVINMVSTGTIEQGMLGVLKFKSELAQGILDKGEDCIFMGESRFKKFMKSVEGLIDSTSQDDEQKTTDISNEDDRKDEQLAGQHEPKDLQQLTAAAFLDDDGDTDDPQLLEPANAEQDFANGSGQPETNGSSQTPTNGPAQMPSNDSLANDPTEELVQNGVDFFGQLAKTLSSKEATEKLVSSIVQKDEHSGRTYLKIPVENEKVIENAVSVIGGLLKSFQSKQ